MPKPVIGLDIGSSSVKATQGSRHGDRFIVQKQAARSLPRGAIYDGHVDPKKRQTVVRVLQSLAEQEKFDTRDVVIGLNSSASVFMDPLETQAVAEKDRASALDLLIQAMLMVDEAEYDYTIVGESPSGGLRLLVYRAMRSYVEEVARMAEEAGFRVVGADFNALAALRASQVTPRPEGQVDAFCDVGGGVVSLLVHRSGVPVSLALDPDVAGARATGLVADALDIDEDDPAAEFHKVNDDATIGLVHQAREEYCQILAKRIASIVRNVIVNDDTIDSLATLTLVGGGARIAGLDRALYQALPGIPVSYAAYDRSFTTDASVSPLTQDPETNGDFLVSVGLAAGRTEKGK